MSKKNIKFLLPLAVTLIIITIIKSLEPEEIDWTKSFAKKDKIPYGGYIIFNLTPHLFPGSKIELKEYPIYNTIKNNYYSGTNYVFINNSFSPDKLDTEYLLNYAAEGNNVFISASGIFGSLADSLNIITYDIFFGKDSVRVNFYLNDAKDDSGYIYTGGYFESFFSQFDTASAQVLGYNDDGKVNFLRIKFGNGNFLLNLIPMAFTNYYLLNSGNTEYVYSALSHLPVQKTLWDDYYKDGNKYNASILQYIISQKPLQWAYFTILVSVILFILFYGRRRQRIIPVIPQLTNTTLEFVATVANLYYQQKDFKNIAEKRIYYFMDYIRNKYSVKSVSSDNESLIRLSEKSSILPKKLKLLFSEIETIQNKKNISEEELIRLNKQIENFYERTR
jgi:hypothetical protein